MRYINPIYQSIRCILREFTKVSIKKLIEGLKPLPKMILLPISNVHNEENTKYYRNGYQRSPEHKICRYFRITNQKSCKTNRFAIWIWIICILLGMFTALHYINFFVFTLIPPHLFEINDLLNISLPRT